MRRTRLSKATVTALAFLGGLLLAELVARLAFDASSQPPRCEGEILQEGFGSDRGFRLAPGSSMRMTIALADGTEQVVEHPIGPHGWRGAPFPARPEPGTLRIGCVGDSNVFGWGVAEEQCWPVLLGVELAAASRRVEVLNFGIPNLDAQDKVEVAQRVAFESGCEVVLFALHFDDLVAGEDARPRLGGGARALRATRPGELPWLDRLRSLSRCVDLAVERYRQHLLSRAYLAHRERMLGAGSPELEALERTLAELARDAQERSVEVFGLVLPVPVREGDGFASASVDVALSQALERSGLAELALAEDLALCPGELWVHPLDLHFNARGHAAIARTLARQLLERVR
jgi:lysophospholipase L1-like esterase